MTDIIQQLAQLTGTTESDVMSFCQSMANEMSKDKAAEFFTGTDVATQTDMIQAYAKSAARTTEQLKMKYLTNSELREYIQAVTYHRLSASA